MLATNSLDRFKCFAANALFEGISSELLEEIRDEIKPLRLKEGEVIFDEGDPGDADGVPLAALLCALPAQCSGPHAAEER